MSDISIKEVLSKDDLRSFVDFPFQLYKSSPHWVPPLVADEIKTFSPEINPAYDHAETKLFLAIKAGNIVGRIAAILHAQEFKEAKKMRFGWIDFEDDPNISARLLQAVEEWARSVGAKTVHGPLGFNDMDFEGMLVDGFDLTPTIATIYNYAYYPDHLERLDYKKSVEWMELKGEVPQQVPQRLERAASYVKERFELHTVKVKNARALKPYGIKFFQTLNNSFTDLYGFYPLTEKESNYVLDNYMGFLAPKYVSLVANKEEEIVAFGVTMPSLSEAFKKANGSLFPFGFISIAKAMLFNKHLDMYLIGINPEYQNTGAIHIVFHELWTRFAKMGIKTIHANPLLESNEKMFKVWQSLGGGTENIIKRRRCYEKEL